MQIDWFTFGAQIVNFLILIALLQRFLYKPVVKAMEEREQRIASELEDARQKKLEAEHKEKELAHKLKNFEEQKSRMLEDARREIGDRRKEWMDELRNEISEIRSRWVEAIESEKEAFLEHLKRETGKQVVFLIERVLNDLSERNLQQQTADFFFEKLKQLDKAEKDQLKKNIEELKTSRAEILSSFELDKKQKERLVDLLEKTAGIRLECDFKETAELGFGLEIHVGGWRLGWNLESYIDGVRRDMDRFFQRQSPIQKSTK